MIYKDIKPNTIGIYKITSPTNRVYIGQSVCLKTRLRTYFNQDVSSQPKLHRSFKKYGVKNHKFEIITECLESELNELERYCQDLYNVLECGLNCLLTKTSDRSGKMSEEMRQKKSDAVKGDKYPMWGKKFSEESKLKMSITRKGVKLTQEHKDKISNTMKQKPKPLYLKKSGLDNNKAIAIKSYNIITGESFVLNLSYTSKHFNCDRELITNRANGITGEKRIRKHKDWRFEILNNYDKSK